MAQKDTQILFKLGNWPNFSVQIRLQKRPNKSQTPPYTSQIQI